ncbi:MAG: FomA family porin-like outer membrane protein [Fusobacteriaceae bacterium]
MKKLALILGTLVVVSSMAAAKEVVATPIPTKEVLPTPIVVCPEIVPEWRPTGYIQLTQKYYADGEHRSIASRFSRSEFIAQVNLTEADKVWFRSRFYQNYVSDSKNADLGALNGYSADSNDRMEIKYSHNFGKVYDKIGFESLVNYEQRQTYKRAQVGGTFDFTDYMGWSPEWFKNTFLGLETLYRYEWKNNGDNYVSMFRPAIYTSWNLPYGFTFDANGYMYAGDNNGSFRDSEGKHGAVNFTGEFYLNRSWTLYSNNSTAYKFNFAGGLDDYGIYGHNEYDSDLQEFSRDSKNYYEFYMEPHFRVDHKVNKFTTLFATAGAEYRNFEFNTANGAKHWRWRPVASAGFKTTF